MRACSPELAALLESGAPIVTADLYTITLASGVVLRYSAGDVDVTLGGNTWPRGELVFERGRARLFRGLEVDELDVTVYASPGATILGGAAQSFLRNGGLDGAFLALERAFAPGHGQAFVGSLLWFYGRVAPLSGSGTAFRIQVKSALELLNRPMPRNVYQPACLNTLFDATCRVNKAAFAVPMVISSGSTSTVAAGSALDGVPRVENYFALGTVEFTSGANAGQKRTVRASGGGSGATLTLLSPLPAPPAIGDTFTAFPGCDKQQATCSGKFNNLPQFRGFPYIPTPETAR